MNDFAARCRPTSYGVGSVRSRSENDAMPDGVGRCRTGNPSVYYCYVTLYTWVFYYLFDVYPPKFKYVLCKRTDGVAASDLSRAWTFFCRSGKKSHVAVRQAPYGKSCTWTPGFKHSNSMRISRFQHLSLKHGTQPSGFVPWVFVPRAQIIDIRTRQSA